LLRTFKLLSNIFGGNTSQMQPKGHAGHLNAAAVLQLTTVPVTTVPVTTVIAATLRVTTVRMTKLYVTKNALYKWRSLESTECQHLHSTNWRKVWKVDTSNSLTRFNSIGYRVCCSVDIYIILYIMPNIQPGYCKPAIKSNPHDDRLVFISVAILYGVID